MMPMLAKEPLSLKIYRSLSRAGEPIANFALRRRLQKGKEDPDRIDERRGITQRARPDGPLVWIHGASVGESLSVVPLVARLRERRSDLNFLVTTGTVTSANLMAKRLPEGAFHQYIPLDHPDFVTNFLDYWQPQMAVFVESEFWPNLILSARDKVPTMTLVNGRISPRSFEDWKRQPNSIKYILSSFDKIIAQDYQNAERLTTLSGNVVGMLGNLKNAAAPLPADDSEIAKLNSAIGDRPHWLAASTHPGEEEVAINAHKNLRKDNANLLTIIAPRHPGRGEEVRDFASEQSLKVSQRSKNEPILPETEIYIADTLGELGIFYRLSDIAFVGGGITPKGGHNPLEPARLGAAILHGPHTFNFVETYSDMRTAGGAALVRNDRELASAIQRLWRDPKTRKSMVEAARNAAESNAEKILNDICDTLLESVPGSAEAP